MKETAFWPTTSLVASLALMLGCTGDAAPPETGSEPSPGEWKVLFNGRDLDGWHSYGETTVNPGWIVEDGAIVLDVGEDTTEMTGGDLITNEQYENFELELEWKLTEGGNSGVFFGVQEIPEHEVAYETGIEMQVLDDDVHQDGKVPETSAGSCYALYAPVGKELRPVGEYNSVRLVVRDGHVEHWLNGKQVVEYVIGSDDWKERVAKSKFADWEHFARYQEGHIGLQDHSDRVWFRNIRIREL
ncbi:MAG: 3-keto-disaccharide hydrolase [Woeseiaceae bacterium]